MNVRMVSFFTEDYLEHALKLRDSGVKFQVQGSCEMRSCANWKSAVMYKPHFIMEKLLIPTRYEELDGILWTDADSAFKSKPDWSIFKDVDFACHVFKRSPHHNEEYLTGTMFFRRSPLVIDFVKAWGQRTKEFEYSHTPEQAALKQTLVEDGWAGKLKVARLDPEWCWIHDDFPKIYGYRFPIIEHYQASRVKRREEKIAAQKAKQAKKGRKA